jgi:glyoxylase-like metal-dependent hydrolase (beta-lactamase superfamily II)
MTRVVRVLAPNPGPFTLEGTNTWIVGSDPSLVIDPGPDDQAHVESVHRDASPIGAILLTHHHPDHSPGAPRLAALAGAPIMAFRPEPEEARLRGGEAIQAGGAALEAVHTPGHTPDHMAFLDRDARALFTGDAVLGRGTSVIDPPGGDLAAYMRSLETMRRLAPLVLYPGHGPAAWDAMAKLDEYVEHRRLREKHVLDGLADGPRSPEDLVPRIYAGYPEDLYPAAARSVLAHLLKLEREGRVRRAGRGGQGRFELSDPVACARCGRPAVPGSNLCRSCALSALQERPEAAR